MTFLVLNSGSSSLKYALFTARLERKLRGSVPVEPSRAADAAMQLFQQLRSELAEVTAVGHRIVHGGGVFSGPALLDAGAIARLQAVSALAPLHNPPALAVIAAARQALPAAAQVGVFDTGFFAHLPDHASAYALPGEWLEGNSTRRLGFHGIAHRAMYEQCPKPRVITLQLGQGCSVAAIRDGMPVDTSMGATPLEGLVMATRSGDVDAGLLLRLMEERRLTPAQASEALNRRAGLLGLSGESGDMKTLLSVEAMSAGAALAISVFCHRARKYLGAYLAVLGGADAIVFGGGIGENAPSIRARICDGLQWCGIELDPRANAEGRPCISSRDSTVEVRIAAVDEEALIARETAALLQGAG